MEEARFGTLVVIVDKARNLPNRKKIGKQDAYAIVRLGHEVQRTPTDKRAGQVPNWNHEIRFKVLSEAENILKISVFNEDSKTPDLIGDCAIDLTDLYKNHEFDSWFDLKYKDKPAGELYAELTFYYEGPPKPRPKVELGRADPIRGMSKSREGTFISELPAMSSSNTTPFRQDASAAYDGRQTIHNSLSSDAEILLSRLSLQTDPRSASAGYTTQGPYSMSQYAETWDGNRCNAVATPAPGDVRRKSFSAEGTRNWPEEERLFQDSALPYASVRDSQVRGLGPQDPGNEARRYKQGEMVTHRDRWYDHVPSHSTGNGIHRDYRPTQAQNGPMNQSSRALPLPGLQQNTRAGHHYGDNEERFVEPILDPRHGSPNELRNSPRLISPHPEYASGYKQSPVLEQEDFDFDAPNRHCSPSHGTYLAQNQPRYATQQDPVAYNNLRATRTDNIGRARREQSQSMSYGHARFDMLSPGPAGPRPSPSHAKAASTSWATQEARGRGLDARPGLGHAGVMTGSHSALPDYAQELNYQRRTTYASTPAQFTAQNRPLPIAPYAPPSLPAKIPLGLTQEEYDILYER